MKRQIITTADGSKTIQLTDWDEQYHSIHGAIAEAKHVYINNALNFYHNSYPKQDAISILEIGFGTGLNTMLTKIECENLKISIDYVGIDAFPVSIFEVEQLDYHIILETEKKEFLKLHQLEWQIAHSILPKFTVEKVNGKFEDITYDSRFNVIYFDAFGTRVQPELWNVAMFRRLFCALKPNGVLTTYASNGNARRAMISAGFEVKKIPGPPGKREMLRAIKEVNV